MAQSNSNLRIEGTLQETTFFKRNGKTFARDRGGVSAERIATDEKFARTRENGMEFGRTAKSGKLLRDTLRDMMKTGADGQVTGRMVHSLTKVKNLDDVSARGERSVAIGITKPGALNLVMDFEFRKNLALGSVLYAPYTVDATSGEVDIPNFIPKNSLSYPAAATHVRLTSAFAKVDFGSAERSIEYSATTTLAIDTTSTNVRLAPAAVPASSGTKLYVLHVEFTQMVNGQHYSLNGGKYNVMAIVDAAN